MGNKIRDLNTITETDLSTLESKTASGLIPVDDATSTSTGTDVTNDILFGTSFVFFFDEYFVALVRKM